MVADLLSPNRCYTPIQLATPPVEVILKNVVWLIRTPYKWLGYPRNITKFCGSVSAKKWNDFAKLEVDRFWTYGSTNHARIKFYRFFESQSFAVFLLKIRIHKMIPH